MQEKINVLLTISYLGTNYAGWQIQKNANTVQAELEKAFFKIFNEKIEVVGSGRTDAGVHAKNAKANAILPLCFVKKHFFKENKFNFSTLQNSLNQLLPEDIKILSIKKVNLNFNARFNAKQKTYEYKIQCGGILSPFNCFNTVLINQKLDIKKMQKASKFLLGEHDFSAFCSAKTEIENKVRTIFDIKIKQNKNIITFEITGNGFLYNMVRIIVGTLVDVGSGKIFPEDVKKILESQDRTNASKTLPAKGLTLKNVKY